MLGFILRRLVYSVVVILAVIFFLSILVKLVPGDAVDVMMASNAGYTDADVVFETALLGDWDATALRLRGSQFSGSRGAGTE